MVWPILISVALTPRMSAAFAASGELNDAQTMQMLATPIFSTPILAARRIAPSPLCFDHLGVDHSTTAAFAAAASRSFRHASMA
jgi:hypothetical protein